MDKFVVQKLSQVPHPKTKSHLSVNIDAKQRASKYPSGTFHVDDGLLFCSKCNVVIDHVRKSTVDDHLKSKSHAKANSFGKQQSVKTALKFSNNAKAEKIKVCQEWIYACTAANIPLLKSDNAYLREFLTTRVKNGGAIPGSSQLRDEYLLDVYVVEKEELKQKFNGKKVAILTDELSDDEGRYVMDVLAVILDFDELSPHGNTCAYLLDTHFLTSTNNVTVSQTVLKVVNEYDISFDNVLIFNSDNVAYMKKAFSSTLSVIFPNCVHITCHSHIVNLVVSDFKKNFSEITEFVKCFRNLFYIPSGRKSRFLNFLKKVSTEEESVCMPPNPTTKSWSAWLDSVLYHADRFLHYRSFISAELEVSDQPSNSLIRLGEIYEDETYLLKLKAQFDFIKMKAPSLLIYLDYFQMKIPHITQSYVKMNQLLDYLRQNITVDSNDLSKSFNDLEIDHQDDLKKQFVSAFKQAEAKLEKYIVNGGQPASEFLKEIKVLEPRNIVSSSKLHSSYTNIPGFKESVSDEEWHKYVDIFGPAAVSESPQGKVDLKLFWKSHADELPELYKLASHYCTGTLGSYDVERSFSTYNSILDQKRRNLNEQTLKALHFLNWNLRVKNSIKEENESPQQTHVKKVSRHLATKSTSPNSYQDKGTAHNIASSSGNESLQIKSVSSQKKDTPHSIASSSSGATKRMSLKNALKQKSGDELKYCYLCQKEVSYGHQCSECRRVICTFPSCCSIQETSSSVLHNCKLCNAGSGIQNKSKQKISNKRKLKNLNVGTSKEKRSEHKSTSMDKIKEISSGASRDEQGIGPIKLSNITIGMYVRVRFTSSRASGSKIFCGIILNIDQELEEIEVRFLKEVKASGNAFYFIWPEIDDECWINIVDIVEILKCPVTDSRGHYHF